MMNVILLSYLSTCISTSPPQTMQEADADYFYVVFKGRKPGIYTRWIDCHSQIHNFRDTAYIPFTTLQEAEAAWSAASSTRGRSNILCTHNTMHAGTSSSAGDASAEFVEDTLGQQFLVEISMQHMLNQACATLGIGEPRYTQQSVKMCEGRPFYRFYASMATNLIGSPPVSMGRYADTVHKAREDVALTLLRRLLAGSTRLVNDFNFRNMRLYEKRIGFLEVENFDLTMENAQLKKELQEIRKNLNV